MPKGVWFRDYLRHSPRPTARLLRLLLGWASLPYGWIVRRRNAAYDSGKRPIHRLPIPVISVGNLTVGGTGKTPMVAWLAQWLVEHGRRVALVSRGYGASAGQQNDEAQELADRLPTVPHLQQRDRFAAGQQALLRHRAQILVLDDAFQHRRLHRDLDVVLIDAIDPFGGDHLLPRGLLREPVSSLSRASFIILTRADTVERTTRDRLRQQAAQLAPAAYWLEAGLTVGSLLRRDHPPLDSERLQGARVFAFCGLGNPLGFRHTLTAAGATIVHFETFPDHHHYTAADLDKLARQVAQWNASRSTVDLVVCTHKDWVKVHRDSLADCPLVAMTVNVRWLSPPAPLEQALAALTQAANKNAASR